MAVRASDITRLLRDLGETLTLRLFNQDGSSDGYDVTSGVLTKSSDTESVIGYIGSYDLTEMNGDSVVFGDKKVYLSASSPEPSVGDEVSGNGDTLRVVSVQTVFSAGDVVCYICQARE